MPSEVRLTKLEAAHRQLETAIVLMMREKDPASTHTLAHAAHTVLENLGKGKGVISLAKGPAINYLPPSLKRDYVRTLNAPANFLKHADQDPDAVFVLRPVTTHLMLFDACKMYRELTPTFPPVMVAFWTWFMKVYPKYFEVLYPEGEDKSLIRQLMDALPEPSSLEDKALLLEAIAGNTID